MKILVLTQYFWPESFIINDLVSTLARQGHSVEVLTGKPNYPDGYVFPGYEAQGCTEELFEDSVRVNRVPLRPRGAGGARNLFLNYLSFVTNGLRYFHRAVRNGHYDVILVFAPSPITSAIPAIFLKWRTRSHLAVWIQDLWPESLSATGFVRNRVVLGAVGLLVRAIYTCADTLLVQSRAFLAPVARYARPAKIVYYPNSYADVRNTGAIDGGLPPELLRLLEDHFCVIFAGNLGTAQSLETLAHAAERLKHLPSCKVVVVGSGSMQGWLETQKAQRGLDNLFLAGRFAPAAMPPLFARAAGLLVTLRRSEIFSYTVPSKIQAYLAAGRPIIAALDGAGARVVEEAGSGLTCPAEDAAGLARCIETLFHMTESERELLGRAGRAYFLEHFEMEGQAKRLVRILTDRMNSSGRGRG